LYEHGNHERPVSRDFVVGLLRPQEEHRLQTFEEVGQLRTGKCARARISCE
jgi:hypothetical protein